MYVRNLDIWTFGPRQELINEERFILYEAAVIRDNVSVQFLFSCSHVRLWISMKFYTNILLDIYSYTHV